MSDDSVICREEFPNLPTVQSPMIVPDVKEFEEQSSTLQGVQKMNLKMDHYIFKRVGDAWGKADSIDDIGKCMCLTHQAIREHRNHMLYPNALQTSYKGQGFVEPIA